MKRVTLLLLLCCLCLPLLARDQKHKLEIAYEGSDYTYREPHTDQKARLTAKKKGFDIVYTRQSVLSGDLTDNDPSFASLEFRYMDGRTDWEDSTRSKVDTNVKDSYMEAALKFGRKFQMTEPLQLRPYLGIGWRESRHGDDPFDRKYLTVDAGVSYEEDVDAKKTKATYFYIPIGTSLIWDMGDNFALSFNGEFDWLIHGCLNVHAPDYFNNSDNLSVSLNQGYGVRFSAKAELDFGSIGVFVEPFWRYWQVQRSSKSWYELGGVPDGGCTRSPVNNTREYGIRTGISF